MEKEILRKVDLTLLKADAKDEEYNRLVEEAHNFGCASVCVPPYRVEYVDNYQKRRKWNVPICTVVGFPKGYSTTKVKVAEALEAIQKGASEIDMVINRDAFKNGEYEYCKNEISALVKSVKTFKDSTIVKVIVESAALSEYEVEILTKMCAKAGADYIKTSTGFDPAGGATMEAVMTMRRVIDDNDLKLKIKASGGIRIFEDFLGYSMVCDRIGASKIDEIK